MSPKLFLATFVALTMLFSLPSSGGHAQSEASGQEGATGKVVDSYQASANNKDQIKHPDWVEYAYRRTIEFLRAQYVDTAYSNNTVNFSVVSAEVDDFKLTHLRLTQTYKNVRIFGSQVTSHLESGAVREITGPVYNDLPSDTKPSIDDVSAIKIARSTLSYDGALADTPKAELIILPRAISRGPNVNGSDLVYQVTLKIEDGSKDTGHHQYFISAWNGEVVWSYNSLESGIGNSLYSGRVNISTLRMGRKTNTNPPVFFIEYSLNDFSRNIQTRNYRNNTTFTQLFSDNWGNGIDTDPVSHAVDAHYGTMQSWDYYAKTYGRRGIDNTGSQIINRVNSPNLNAYYFSGVGLEFGAGDGINVRPFVSPDVVGHEFTHGVTDKTAKLIYNGESGALNESFSDIFGTAIEYYSNNNPDYLIAEDVFIKRGALRSMSNPPAYNSPDHYSALQSSGRVHFNSGIQNKAFYLLAEGGIHPVSKISVTGIGRRSAERIFYRALTLYLFPSANFNDARNATLSSAADLFGVGSAEYKSTAKAWDAVGVYKWIAVSWPNNNKTYFFKGNQYYSFNNLTGQIDSGMPLPIAGNWPGLWTDGFDAAFTQNNGKAYFFKGNQVLRMNMSNFSIDRGYPQLIAGNWNSVWSDGIDAVVQWNNNKVYFFKNDQVACFDLIAGDVDLGFPKLISSHFPGLWRSSIDSTILAGHGKAFFFRGSEYSQFDLQTNKVESGFPRSISGQWRGLP